MSFSMEYLLTEMLDISSTESVTHSYYFTLTVFLRFYLESFVFNTLARKHIQDFLNFSASKLKWLVEENILIPGTNYLLVFV